MGAGAATASAARGHHKPHKQKSGGALPSMGAPPSPSIFGIDTAVCDSNASNVVNDFPVARGLGARWDHFTLGAATATGNYKIVDMQAKKARKQHMGVVLSLGGIASACSIRPLPTNVHACPPTTAKDMHTYKAYVRTTQPC